MHIEMEEKHREDMEQFLLEIRQVPRLTPEEEYGLALRTAKGDEEAIRQMVSANLRLVVAVAREYRGRGVPMLDLIQEGSVGLLMAARRYDHTREVRFSTYATKWIRKGVMACLLEYGNPIRIPANTAWKMNAVVVARKKLCQKLGREPDPEEIAVNCGLTTEKVRELLLQIPEMYSLDLEISEDNSLYDTLEAEQECEPYAGLVRQELESIIHRLMNMLDDRQRLVLRLHYGMEDDRCHSFEEIGKRLGVSKERARQIEHQAMAKLKDSGESLGLEDFLNE